MSSLDEVIAALDRVDWDFPQSGTEGTSVHNLHWFPGNFIPQIPSFLIQILSTPGDVVLDPFSGSGTTAVEALRLGRRAIAADRMSACVFITRAKLAALLHPLDRKVRSKLLAQLTWEHACESDQAGRNDEGSSSEISNWYTPHTMRQLRFLWSRIEEHIGPERLVLELLFSDLLFALASTDRSLTSTGRVRRHHWGWVADNVRPKPPVEHNAIDGFRSRLLTRFSDEWSISPGLNASVLQQDARAMALRAESVDLIVTSPPYVGMIDYTLANRLLYAWKGWPTGREREQEIGARYKRFRHLLVEEYMQDISKCWREFSRVMRRGGFCAVVLGESRRFPGSVDRAMKGLRSVLQPVWGPVVRRPSRRRVSDRAAREATETICVFRKA